MHCWGAAAAAVLRQIVQRNRGNEILWNRNGVGCDRHTTYRCVHGAREAETVHICCCKLFWYNNTDKAQIPPTLFHLPRSPVHDAWLCSGWRNVLNFVQFNAVYLQTCSAVCACLCACVCVPECLCSCVIKSYANDSTNLFVLPSGRTMAHAPKFCSDVMRDAWERMHTRSNTGGIGVPVWDWLLIYCHLYTQSTKLTIKTKMNSELGGMRRVLLQLFPLAFQHLH